MHGPILTLLTDFGSNGPYVGAMKGVILSIAPQAHLVDISHAITPQNILEGAFVLASVQEWFPPGTIHLAVVDPGVGTDRRLVAVQAGRQWFVLPDNGLVSGVLRNQPPTGIWRIDNPKLWKAKVSRTFHGRDILAPAAAFLANEGNPDDLGPRETAITRLDLFDPSHDQDGWIGEVIFRDSFGNLVTNVSQDLLDGESWKLEIKGVVLGEIVKTYAERPTGTLVALEGSSGWIEVAVVNGDASRRLEAGPGTTVRFRKNKKDKA